jgi:hypothetical protein
MQQESNLYEFCWLKGKAIRFPSVRNIPCFMLKSIPVNSLISDLFNDSVAQIVGCFEQRTEKKKKDVEESGCGLFFGIIPNMHWQIQDDLENFCQRVSGPRIEQWTSRIRNSGPFDHDTTIGWCKYTATGFTIIRHEEIFK